MTFASIHICIYAYFSRQENDFSSEGNLLKSLIGILHTQHFWSVHFNKNLLGEKNVIHVSLVTNQLIEFALLYERFVISSLSKVGPIKIRIAES